jgi:squalene-hopene/tetraprenyl-beta-curcumene cyclase
MTQQNGWDSPAGDPGSAAFPEGVRNAISAGRRFLLSLQQEDGHWCGELEGDTILESEYALTMHFLGRTGEERIRKAAEHLRRKQLPDGGWAIYPGGPAEVSASVKAYFVLKLVGDDPQAPHMSRARETIRAMGGIDACNSFTKIYLSLFGQYDWDRCPAVPPELVLLPDWFPFNLYRMSSWSRGIVVPLSVIWASKPFCPVPEEASLRDLAGAPRPRRTRRARRPMRERLWIAFFAAIDRALKAAERANLRPLRRRALARAERWILDRLPQSDGLGAIFPPIINTILALRCLGYAADDPVLQSQVRELEKLELEDEDSLWLQPCFSPVWDTALALRGLRESGLPADHPAVLRGAEWLLSKEVRSPGDWKKRNPGGEPGGWYFEYANEFYPDCDDTAEVLTALAKVRFPDEPREAHRRDAIRRGAAWLVSMQNSDGGWAAFDRDCDDEVLTLIPFADHNAMIDPSCEDITGRTLEALSELDYPASHPAVRAAVAFLHGSRAPDGTWYGRWGCNYVYGTWLAVRGLRRSGQDAKAPAIRSAAEWLYRHQNGDGGWGELPRSYDDPDTKGVGPSTPSQTAWALLTLFAAGDFASLAVRRGIEYLLSRQRYDGSWKDEHWTGTGFPKVFYLRYHLYATYFPLWALSEYQRARRGSARDRKAGEYAAGVAAEE